MGEKKSFFNERTVGEIRKLNSRTAYRQSSLVEEIDALNIQNDALEIRVLLIPQQFRRGELSQYESARKYWKHGPLIKIKQPEKFTQAVESDKTPLSYRIETFEEVRESMKEGYAIGYYWKPATTTDHIARIVPFVNIAEGARLFTYAQNYSSFRQKQNGQTITKKGIKVEPYADAQRVKQEGADVVVHVPSRTEKKEKYHFRLLHVPYEPTLSGGNNLAIISRLKPATIISENEPIVGRTPHSEYDIKYEFKNAASQSEVIKFTPQDVAGYMGVIKRQLEDNFNWTALTYNPFALPSRKQATFYTKLCNNVLIFDPTLKSPKHNNYPDISSL